MAEVVATKGITFKMDSEILDIASSVLREHGYSLSKGMTLFLKNVALTKSVDLPNEKEIDNELLFMKLKEEVPVNVRLKYRMRFANEINDYLNSQKKLEDEKEMAL